MLHSILSLPVFAATSAQECHSQGQKRRGLDHLSRRYRTSEMFSMEAFWSTFQTTRVQNRSGAGGFNMFFSLLSIPNNFGQVILGCSQ